MFNSKTLFKNTSVYGLGLIIGRMIGFVLIPVYTRLLTPSDYGILEILDLVTFVLGIVIFVGLHGASARFYYSTEDEMQRKGFLSTAFLFVLTMAFAATLFVTAFSAQVARVFFQDSSYKHFVQIATVTLMLATVVELAISYLRTRQEAYKATALGLWRLLSNTLLAIALVIGLRKGIWGLLFANLLSNFIFAIYAGWKLWKEVGVHFSWQKLSPMVIFGLPLVLNSASMFALNFADRFFLQRYVSLGEVGIYGLAYKIGMLVNVLINLPFGQSWGPHLFEHVRNPETRSAISRSTSHFAFLVLSFGVVLIAASETTVKLLTPRAYWEAAQLAPIIVLAYVADGFRGIFHAELLAAHKPRVVGALAGAAALLNLSLNMILIKPFGAFGAATATLASFALFSLVSFFFAQKYFPVPYENGRLLRAFALFSMATLVLLFFKSPSLIAVTAIKSLVACAFCASIWQIFDAEEKSGLISIVKNHVFEKVRSRSIAAGLAGE